MWLRSFNIKIFMRIAFSSLLFVFLNSVITPVSLASIKELKERERKVKKVVSELMPTVVAVVGNDQPAT